MQSWAASKDSFAQQLAPLGTVPKTLATLAQELRNDVGRKADGGDVARMQLELDKLQGQLVAVAEQQALVSKALLGWHGHVCTAMSFSERCVVTIYRRPTLLPARGTARASRPPLVLASVLQELAQAARPSAIYARPGPIYDEALLRI